MADGSDRLRSFLARLSRLAACTFVAGGALVLPGVARADSTNAACAISAMSTASQPACWRPFTASSPFNTPLPTDPLLTSDSTIVQQHMVQYGWSLDGSTSGFTLSGQGTRPVYFAAASDPMLTVHCTDEEGPGTCQGANGIDVNGTQINVPAGAEPTPNGDAHMTVIETATGTEYDFWHVSISGSTLTAGTGAEINSNTSNGIGSAGDAAGFGLTAGLLRPAELASGQIDHALVITVPCTNAAGKNVGYTYPALGGWGQPCGEFWSEDAATAPMLGQRYQLDMNDAQIVASGAPGWEQTIMTALAHYGAYIEDTNGSYHSEGMDILTQDPVSWTDLGQANPWASVISGLGGSGMTLHSSVAIPVSDLQLVDPCVTQGTCPGASGPPLGATAPTGTGSTAVPTTTTTSSAPTATVGSTTSTPPSTSASPTKATSPKRFGSSRRRRARAARRRAALRARLRSRRAADRRRLRLEARRTVRHRSRRSRR